MDQVFWENLAALVGRYLTTPCHTTPNGAWSNIVDAVLHLADSVVLSAKIQAEAAIESARINGQTYMHAARLNDEAQRECAEMICAERQADRSQPPQERIGPSDGYTDDDAGDGDITHRQV